MLRPAENWRTSPQCWQIFEDQLVARDAPARVHRGPLLGELGALQIGQISVGFVCSSAACSQLMTFLLAAAVRRLAVSPLASTRSTVTGSGPASSRSTVSRATTAWVSCHAFDGRTGTRIRTWFEANVTSDGRTPGSPPSPSSRIAVARVSDAPKRKTISPSSREIDEMPDASAASRSSATSTSRRTGGGIGPKRSVTSWRKAARSPAVRARASRRYSSSFWASSGTYSFGRFASSGRSTTACGGDDDRGTALQRRLLLLDRLGQQPRVEVEADRGHVPRLLAAEDVAGAADLEVGQRDLEAGAQLRGVEDRLEPLARLVAQPLAPPIEQVGVGAPARAPDAPAQLVELGEAERVGAVDDDRVGVGDVEPRFDDRRADEHVGLAVGEREHHALERALAHLAVPDDEPRVRQHPPELLGLRLDGLDAVVDVEDLAAAVELAQDRVADEPGRRLGDPGLDRQPVLRRRLDDGQVADAGQRQVERPRDRRGRERQHVHLGAEPLEPLLGGHAEPLLLVDDDQAEVLEPRRPC